MAALGISYGISWHQGTDYTWEEALQAIALAAIMRGGLTAAKKYEISKSGGALTLTPSVNPADIIGAPRLAQLAAMSPSALK